MITPETLTDEMIAALLREAGESGDHQMAADCQLAQLKRDRHWTRVQRWRQKNAIRRICDALNARAESPLGQRGHASWCMSIKGDTGACDCGGDSEDEVIERDTAAAGKSGGGK